MIYDEAVTVSGTRVALVLAGVDTAQVATVQVAGTVLVRGALGALALNLRVAQVAGQTLAGGTVILASALGVRGATVLKDAWVNTLLVEAGVGVGTVVVGLALN